MNFQQKPQTSQNCPRSLKESTTLMHASWTLSPTPGEAESAQVKFEDSLRKQLERIKLKDEIIKVKFSGDGTQIGKRLKIVNFTYTILNEKEAAMGEKGNYILAIIKTTESYENLKESLFDLSSEMTSLTKITVNDKTYTIEYFLGGGLESFGLCLWIGGPKPRPCLYMV